MAFRALEEKQVAVDSALAKNLLLQGNSPLAVAHRPEIN
jgi:hypothetical protein